MPTDGTDEGPGGVAEPPESRPAQQSSRTTNNNTSANANNNGRSAINNNSNNNRTAAPPPPPPPAYPCGDVCASCGKKVSEMGGEEAADRPTSDAIRECACGCHKQDSVMIQMPAVPPQPNSTSPTPPGLPAHVPPGGADCLPGCGYSGLPCYNCSLRPDPTPRRPTEMSAAFPPQIYTVELQDNMVGSQGPEVIQGRTVLQSDEDPRAKKRRRTCLSILIAIIAVNVAFQMFKLL